MPLTRLTPLDGDAILPLKDAKEQVRVTHDDEDNTITVLRDAAIRNVERVSGVILAPTEFRWTAPRFGASIELPVGPVISLEGVTFLDAAGAEQIYADARLVGNSVMPAAGSGWPAAHGQIAVEFTAGLDAPEDAPELLAAVRLKLTALEDRGRSRPEVIDALERAADNLIGTHLAVLM